MLNIRVYGIVQKGSKVLVTDETYNGIAMTKFPGGGMENKESSVECLHREFKEELNCTIEIEKHFYTTDFYQNSAFKKEDQIFSIYYKVRLIGMKDDSLQPFTIGKQHFRWLTMNEQLLEQLTFPIDKKVATLL